MVKQILTLIILFVVPLLGIAQDVSFSQITNNKLYLNPAFANSRRCPELTMSYRNQWPSLGSKFVTSILSYEQSFLSSKNGVGLMLINDRSANGIYSLNSVSTFYSNQQRINRNLNVKFGLELGYKQNFIDSDKLFFEDSFNGESFTSFTAEPLMTNLKVHYFDMGAGLLFFNKDFFTGMSFSHINTPNQSLVFGESNLPVKYNLHAGGNISLDRSTDRRENIIYMPAISMVKQGEFLELTLNNNVKKGDFLIGAGFRFVEGYSYRDALILNFGVDTGELLFFYGYDITVSPLGPTTGGAHEITTVIKVSNKYRRNKIEVPSCAF